MNSIRILITFIYGSFILSNIFNVFAKPLGKLIVTVKQHRHDEMQQGPKFSHGVLHWSSREKESVPALEAKQTLPADAAKLFIG